jgi:hypothetical protein
MENSVTIGPLDLNSAPTIDRRTQSSAKLPPIPWTRQQTSVARGSAAMTSKAKTWTASDSENEHESCVWTNENDPSGRPTRAAQRKEELDLMTEEECRDWVDDLVSQLDQELCIDMVWSARSAQTHRNTHLRHTIQQRGQAI